jgi:Dolichyl-phosphate-mannose-protein mannosyltransferase
VTELRNPPVAKPRTQPDAPPQVERARPWHQRVFPGDRHVWLAGGGAILVLGIVLLVSLLVPREYFTGSNSVAARDYVAPAFADQPLCVDRIRVPLGTGRVRWGVDTRVDPRPALSGSLRLDDGTVIPMSAPASADHGFHRVDMTLNRPIPAAGGKDYRFGTLCMRPAQGQIFVWGRTQMGMTDKPLRVGKKQSIPNRVALWFLPRDHEKRSILSQLPTIFERASLFRPGPVGPWTFWLLLFCVMPLLAYAGLRTIANADVRLDGRVPLALKVAAIAFALAATWALITPTFETPDESEHFAAAQYFAETGKAVDLVQGKKGPWSTSEAVVIDATRELTTIERPEAKMPWLKSYEGAYRARNHNHGKSLPRDDGGGFHPATSSWSPLYYALNAPAYLLVKDKSVFVQLTAMRWTSALMGAITAMLGMLVVLELLPRRRALAASAGLLIAFLPQFGFISGAVNNDNGVNLGAALIIYLLIRALRRGWTVPVAISLGFILVLTPLFKGTGYELYPPAILALVGIAFRRHGRRDLAMLALAGVSFIVFFEVWEQVKGSFDRTTFATPGGGTPGTSFGALHHLKAYLVWLWQVMVPVKLWFMQDFTVVHWPFFNIYVMRGFAGLGWYAIFFHKWVYVVVVVVMVVILAGGVRLLWRERHGALRRYLPEVLFLASVPIVVVAAVEAAYFTLAIPTDGTAEQGRYAFPAITAVAAIVIGGCLGLGGRKRALPIAAALVAGLAMMTYAGQFLTLSTFYT